MAVAGVKGCLNGEQKYLMQKKIKGKLKKEKRVTILPGYSIVCVSCHAATSRTRADSAFPGLRPDVPNHIPLFTIVQNSQFLQPTTTIKSIS